MAALGRARPAWLAAAVLLDFAILPLAAWQWTFLLPAGTKVPFGRMLWITLVTSTVSNGGPFLAGHAAGIHLLATRGGTGHATAVSVKALDQLAEGVAKLVLVGTLLLLAPLPAGLRASAGALTVAVPALALALLLSAHRAHALERWAERAPGRRGAAAAFLAEVARQLETVRRPGRLAVGVALALAQKVVEGGAIWAVVVSLGVDVPAWGIVLSLTAVNLSTMASVTPANLGIYEASAVLAFVAAGLTPETALGVAVLQHLAYLVPLAGAGWLVLALSGGRGRVPPRDARDLAPPADRAGP